MQDPAESVRSLIETNYLASITDPAKASVRFLTTYFDTTGKIHSFQISVLSGPEPSRQLVMGVLPKFEFRPEVLIHIWTTVLPGKTIAQARTSCRNMIDEAIRIIRVNSILATDLSFIGSNININSADELGQVEPGEMRRLHRIMRVQGIFFKNPLPPVLTADVGRADLSVAG